MENLYSKKMSEGIQGLMRSSKPHSDCHATMEALMSSKKNPLDVMDDCPICQTSGGILCQVGCHPSVLSAGKLIS